jgi:hypothetical protein
MKKMVVWLLMVLSHLGLQVDFDIHESMNLSRKPPPPTRVAYTHMHPHQKFWFTFSFQDACLGSGTLRDELGGVYPILLHSIWGFRCGANWADCNDDITSEQWGCPRTANLKNAMVSPGQVTFSSHSALRTISLIHFAIRSSQKKTSEGSLLTARAADRGQCITATPGRLSCGRPRFASPTTPAPRPASAPHPRRPRSASPPPLAAPRAVAPPPR